MTVNRRKSFDLLFLLFFVSGNIVVLGSSNLIASNIRNNINIFGVWGTFVGVPSRESDYFVWARGVGQTPYCAPGVWITTSYPISGSSVWHSLVGVWGVNSYISGGWDRLLVSTNVHSRDSTSWTTFWVYNYWTMDIWSGRKSEWHTVICNLVQ